MMPEPQMPVHAGPLCVWPPENRHAASTKVRTEWTLKRAGLVTTASISTRSIAPGAATLARNDLRAFNRRDLWGKNGQNLLAVAQQGFRRSYPRPQPANQII